MAKYREIYRCKRCGQEIGGYSISTTFEVNDLSTNVADMERLRDNAQNMLCKVCLHECSDGKLGVVKFVGYDLRR